MATKLADLFVEINTKGVQGAKQELEAVKGSMFGASVAATAIGTAISSAFTAGLGAIGNFISSLMNFVQQGFQGTAEMEFLNSQLELLSQTMASVLAPILEIVTELVVQFREVFQKLAEPMQRVVGIFADIFMTLIQAALPIVQELATQFADMANVWADVLQDVADIIVTVVMPVIKEMLGLLKEGITMALDLAKAVGLYAREMTSQARKGLGLGERKRRGFTPLTRKGGAFEAVTETWRRLQQSAMKTDIPAKHLAVAEKQLRELQRMNNKQDTDYPALVGSGTEF